MHDFLLAKEIIDKLKQIVEEKKLSGVRSIKLEIGAISLAHDGFSEHEEDISVENLEFGLKSIAKGTVFENVDFRIGKVAGTDWKITDIEVE